MERGAPTRYAASKDALNTLTISLLHNLAPAIRISAVIRDYCAANLSAYKASDRSDTRTTASVQYKRKGRQR